MKMVREGVLPPARKTKGSCGYDIHCPENTVLFNGMSTVIDTGIVLEEGDIPEGCFAMIVPRSSMGFKYGLRMDNTVGIIDSDYRDPIKASLTTTREKVFLERNMRILQMIVVPFGLIPGEKVPTEDRTGGLGSTGV